MSGLTVPRAALALLLAAAGLPASGLVAQERGGATSAAVLRLSPDPRAAALGGALVAWTADETALFHNPAWLAAGTGRSLGMSYQMLPTGIGAGGVAAAMRYGPGGIAVGVRFLDLGRITELEPDPDYDGQRGRATGERVGAGDVAVEAGYGLRIGPVVSVGVVARILSVQLAEAADHGPAADVGVGFELPNGRGTAGVAIQHIGPGLGPGTPSPLPRTLRAGAKLRLGSGETRAGDVFLEVRAADARLDQLDVAGGIEAELFGAEDLIVIGRLGFESARFSEDLPSPLSAGAAVALGGRSVQYAYHPLGAMGAAHHFGVRFATPRPFSPRPRRRRPRPRPRSRWG